MIFGFCALFFFRVLGLGFFRGRGFSGEVKVGGFVGTWRWWLFFVLLFCLVWVYGRGTGFIVVEGFRDFCGYGVFIVGFRVFRNFFFYGVYLIYLNV